jgi:hypothetical protein
MGDMDLMFERDDRTQLIMGAYHKMMLGIASNNADMIDWLA